MSLDAILAAHKDLSRRGFFTRTVKAAGIALFWEKYGDRLFGQTVSKTDPAAVIAAMGNIIIPIDDDPGYASFEPGITKYTMGSFIPQVMLGGDPFLLSGINSVIQAFNDLPPVIGYSTNTFLQMSEFAQSAYYGSVLAGGFENYGTQDVMFLAAFVGLFATKGVFFSNYPNHLATPGAEFQVVPASKIKTGWEIIGFKGPVGQAEEAQLRAKYKDHTVLPGMDPNNPYI